MPSADRRLAVLALLVAGAGCVAAPRTILIPRLDAAARGADPFDGATFVEEREVDGQTYALVAAAFDTSLVLGVRVPPGFAGEATLLAGDQRIQFALGRSTPGVEVPLRVTGDRLEPAIRGRRSATGVEVELPHGTLRYGDGTVSLELVPADGRDVIRLPATGRLRGVYLKT